MKHARIKQTNKQSKTKQKNIHPINNLSLSKLQTEERQMNIYIGNGYCQTYKGVLIQIWELEVWTHECWMC